MDERNYRLLTEGDNTKDIIRWIDLEFSIIHILIYITMGLIVGGRWWWLFGSLIAYSIYYGWKVVRKMDNPRIYKD